MIDPHIKCLLISMKLKSKIMIWLIINFYKKTSQWSKYLKKFSNFLDLMSIIYQQNQKNGLHNLDPLKLILVANVFWVKKN